MLVEMWSPAFKEEGEVRPIIRFDKGLNVVLGKEDGAMSIGKSTSLLAIDFAFGGDAYIKSDGVKHEGHHFIYFAFQFDGATYRFARNTGNGDVILRCDESYKSTGEQVSKAEFTAWLAEQYGIAFSGLSFRVALSSFFRIYGKQNTDELHPLQGIPGQNMEKSISTLVALFDRYKDIEEFKGSVDTHTRRLKVFREARSESFISNLVGGKAKYEENLATIRSLELQLDTLVDDAESGHSEEDIERNKQKSALVTERLALEEAIRSRERKLRLVNMNLEYGLYPTEADLAALQEFFPDVNICKLYEIEQFHQKLAKILDAQFAEEKAAIEAEISELQQRLGEVRRQISELGFVGNISREFLDRHSELKAEIAALTTQNEAFLNLKALQDAKANATEVLRKGIESILREIEVALNTKMEEFNDLLFPVKKKPPYVHFNAYNSYHFETPDNTGTGSNYKGMIVYDLAVLFSTALPAIAHDSLLFSNLGKDAVDGIVGIYMSTDKQVFISYDKQGDCRPETRRILESRQVLKLSNDGHELYGRSWDEKEPEENEDELQQAVEAADRQADEEV